MLPIPGPISGTPALIAYKGCQLHGFKTAVAYLDGALGRVWTSVTRCGAKATAGKPALGTRL